MARSVTRVVVMSFVSEERSVERRGHCSHTTCLTGSSRVYELLSARVTGVCESTGLCC